MSEAKHTLGPWVRGDGDPHRILSSSTWDCVAEVNDALPDSEANANLIAAAPDLLSALERMECTFYLLLQGKLHRDADEVLAKAQAALDKAQGHSL